MTKISLYPEISTPDVDDLLIGTDVENNNATKNFTIQSVIDLVSDVGSIGPQGPQGVQGPAGPLGPVGPAGLEWQGAWVSGTSYVENDAVGYGGASWFCILATSGTTTPDLDITNWALLASQGAQGVQGVQGPTGAQGPAGGVEAQTFGSLEIENVSPYQILSYDLNSITTTGASDKVVLPSSADVGKIIYVFAMTNANSFTVRANQAGSALISPNGISSQTSSITVGINESYLFTSLGGGYWKSEAIGPSLQQVFNVGKKMTTGNFTAAVFDLAPGLSIKNTSTLSETTIETGKITFTKNQGGLKTTNLFQAVTPTVNRTIYFPDADGTIALTSDVNNRLVVETASPYILTDTDSGGMVIFTSSTTLTIPTGLANGFECTFVTLAGVTLTVSAGSNVLNNATSTTMLPQLSFTLKRMLATNTYIVAGSL